MGAGGDQGAGHRLLLANRTLTDPVVEAAVGARPPGTRWTVVVPATPPDAGELAFLASEHLPTWGAEAPGVALARLRLRWALDRLSAGGLDVRGEVGDPDPARAAAAVLRREAVEEIVVALLPGDRSTWRRRRVAQQLGARHRVPVTTVTATGVDATVTRPRRAVNRGASAR